MLEKIRYDQRYATLPVVIRCRSFAGAARELALTPSAVSAQVRSLERELGVPLFTTVKKELVPTDKCRLVAEYIEKNTVGLPADVRRGGKRPVGDGALAGGHYAKRGEFCACRGA